MPMACKHDHGPLKTPSFQHQTTDCDTLYKVYAMVVLIQPVIVIR